MLMYGSENWDLNSSERRKIETADTCFIRRISLDMHLQPIRHLKNGPFKSDTKS